MSATVKNKSCFTPIANDDRKLLAPTTYPKKKIVRVFVPYSEQIGDDENNIVLKYKPIVKEEYDIEEYINSFADEVGIQNIIKKVALTGDKSLLNQTHRESLNPDGGLEPIQDYTDVPSSKAEAFEAVRKGVLAYDNLPEDIKGKMSFAQFAAGFGQEDLDAYVQKIVQASQPKQEGGNE